MVMTTIGENPFMMSTFSETKKPEAVWNYSLFEGGTNMKTVPIKFLTMSKYQQLAINFKTIFRA